LAARRRAPARSPPSADRDLVIWPRGSLGTVLIRSCLERSAKEDRARRTATESIFLSFLAIDQRHEVDRIIGPPRLDRGPLLQTGPSRPLSPAIARLRPYGLMRTFRRRGRSQGLNRLVAPRHRRTRANHQGGVAPASGNVDRGDPFVKSLLLLRKSLQKIVLAYGLVSRWPA
jgi:hypothetical protein